MHGKIDLFLLVFDSPCEHLLWSMGLVCDWYLVSAQERTCGVLLRIRVLDISGQIRAPDAGNRYVRSCALPLNVASVAPAEFSFRCFFLMFRCSF